MGLMLRFAQPWFFYWLVPVLVAAVVWRYGWYKPAYYRYSLAHSLSSQGYASSHWFRYVLFLMRFAALATLVILIAKPQLVDKRDEIQIEGIDIVLVLDVSGSMQFQDYQDDTRSRLAIAKDEAIRFIDKRSADAIGLVIFGNDAVSRAPLTNDKHMLKELVGSMEIGVINPDGTLLATAMLTAANRLKYSKASSKVMILLTDGEPSEGDLDPQFSIDVAKKMGIKVYTIGIGSDQERLMQHPFLGVVRAPKINAALLTKIAQSTGGQFFQARNAGDMRAIYDTIDSLEKTKRKVPLFNKYYDLFVSAVWALIAMVLLELLLVSTLWFGVY